jgi:hypothetical protein
MDAITRNAGCVRECNRTRHVGTCPWAKWRHIIRRLLPGYSFPVLVFEARTKIQDKFPELKLRKRESVTGWRKSVHQFELCSSLDILYSLLCMLFLPSSSASAMMVLCLTLEHFLEVLHCPFNFQNIYPFCVILTHTTIGANFLRRFLCSQWIQFYLSCVLHSRLNLCIVTPSNTT